MCVYGITIIRYRYPVGHLDRAEHHLDRLLPSLCLHRLAWAVHLDPRICPLCSPLEVRHNPHLSPILLPLSLAADKIKEQEYNFKYLLQYSSQRKVMYMGIAVVRGAWLLKQSKFSLMPLKLKVCRILIKHSLCVLFRWG